MARSLPSSVVDGIDSHIRNIEKERVAGETSASQASLLKQLSELEQALISVRSSLPSKEFVAQLDKLQSVQLRLQGVFDRLTTVEASTMLKLLQGLRLFVKSSMLDFLHGCSMQPNSLRGALFCASQDPVLAGNPM
ncbi:hypothetical protein WJX77_012515 [Trebouxia sp. C0004]